VKAIKEMKKNEHAVSPIVATLVLIVVAVVGAVAVGTIMGTFSSDVAEKNNAGDVAGASATELIIAGSTTMQPVSQNLAQGYMKAKPGMKISVNGGGSGAGLISAMTGVSDIGAMSEDMSTAQKNKYPNAVQHKVGYGAIAIITHKDNPVVADGNVTKADLVAIFDNNETSEATEVVNASVVVYRSDSSGTADSFFKNYLGQSATLPKANTGTRVTTIDGQSGNGKLVDKVVATKNSIGFCDYGYVATRTDVTILAVVDNGDWSPSYDKIVNTGKELYKKNDVLKDVTEPTDNTKFYIKGLIHPLYYITNGQPNSVTKDFITWSQLPAQEDLFKSVNVAPLHKCYAI